MAGNFFATSENVRLEDRHYLRARLQRVDGEWVDSEINLNDHIGNDDGMPCLPPMLEVSQITNAPRHRPLRLEQLR